LTLASGLAGRDNAITPLRLAMAMLVVFSHGFVAGRFGPEPLYAATGGQLTLGTVAVLGFFGLSGFLIERSRETSKVAAYARNRVLRILPALWFCVALTVLVVVPLAVMLGGTPAPDDIRRWALHTATLQLAPEPISGLYGSNAAPSQVNAPLWTLPPEAICYALVACMPRRLVWVGCSALFVMAAAALIGRPGADLYLQLPVAFFMGAILYAGRARASLATRWFVILLLAAGASAIAGVLGVVAPFVLPYASLWIGFRWRARMKADLSYGTYIYGWPIQELLAMTGVAALGFVPYFLLSLVPILAIAYASWHVIELPALRLRHRPAELAAHEAAQGAVIPA
jgi:peptidoglycan/LPS O-acetylase OafA/YrhL